MTAMIAPVVVDLGKQKSKALRALKNGKGPLVEDVAQVLAEVRARSAELASKELIPVVIIYRKKPGRKTFGGLPMPFRMGRS